MDTMRKIFVLVYIVAISYYAGTNCTQAKKDYEAACLFKDIINSSMDMDDEFGRENRNHYDEWVMDFEALELDNLKEEDLDSYYWCY